MPRRANGQKGRSDWDWIPGYKVGDFIKHPKHGRGKILEVSGSYVTLTLSGRPLEVVPILLRVRFPRSPVRAYRDGVWLSNRDFPKGIGRRLQSVTANYDAPIYGPPFFIPDPRPKGARRVRLHSNFADTETLYRLVNELGYAKEAVLSSLPSWGIIRTPRDVWQKPLWNGPDHGGPRLSYEQILPGYGTERVERWTGPSRHKAADGRIDEKIFMSLLAKTRYDLDMQAALRDTLVKGVPVNVVARQRSVSRRVLSDATRKLRKKALNFG